MMKNSIFSLLACACLPLLLSCEAEGERMRARLAEAEQMNQGFVSMDTVEWMDDVVRYFNSHGSAEERMRANYMMGSVYRDRGDSPMALEYFTAAVKSADTTSADYNFHLASRIYGQMANILHLQNYPQRELVMWKKTAKAALHDNDSLMYAQSVDYMSGAYLFMNDTVNAMRMTDKAYRMFKAMGNDMYAATMSCDFIDYYLFRDSLPQAKAKIDEYIACSGFVDSLGNVNAPQTIFYYYQGQYYEKLGKLDSALHFYRRLQEPPSKLMKLEGSYRGLLSVYTLLGQADSVYKYARLYADANDSANIHNTADQVVRMQSLYDYNEYQTAARQKAEESKSRLNMIYIGIILILTVASAATYIIRRIKKHSNQLKQEKKQERQALLNQLMTAMDDLDKVRKDKAAFEKEKNEEIDRLQQELASKHHETVDLDLLNRENALLTHPLVLELHKRAIRGDRQILGHEWKVLTSEIEKGLPAFYKKLSEPDTNLSDKEILICMLTRLQFAPGEIAAIMGLTKQYLSNLRRSANQKIFKLPTARQFEYNILKL